MRRSNNTKIPSLNPEWRRILLSHLMIFPFLRMSKKTSPKDAEMGEEEYEVNNVQLFFDESWNFLYWPKTRYNL